MVVDHASLFHLHAGVRLLVEQQVGILFKPRASCFKGLPILQPTAGAGVGVEAVSVFTHTTTGSCGSNGDTGSAPRFISYCKALTVD